MSDEKLQHELVLLEKLAAVCETTGFENLEKYAKVQADACKEAVYRHRVDDPVKESLEIQYYRGQGDVWTALCNMRTCVASKSDSIRGQLAAKRKEA